MPLHYAVKHATAETVDLLIEAYPDAVRHKDKDDITGRYPLHYAAQAGPGKLSKGVITRLTSMYPEASAAKDIDGKMPHDYVKDPEIEQMLRKLCRATNGTEPGCDHLAHDNKEWLRIHGEWIREDVRNDPLRHP
jgi:hypothetical protein